MRRAVIAIVFYLLASSLTGGYYYNHRCDRSSVPDCGVPSVITAYGWPVYWLGRFGIEVTK